MLRRSLPIALIVGGAATLGCSEPSPAPTTAPVEPIEELGPPGPSEVLADCLDDPAVITGAARASIAPTKRQRPVLVLGIIE